MLARSFCVACVVAACGDNLPEPGPVLVPEIDGDWVDVAGNPDLGSITGPSQQPVDFAVWKAADGTWNIWSCIRFTLVGGNTRLFFHWQGPSLTSPNWTPVGIAMEADPKVGEAQGGLQAPFVFRDGALYRMFYGSWQSICQATSTDGQTFKRSLDASGHCTLFSEGDGANTRDPMVLRVGELWHAYYTAFSQRNGETIGQVYLRTSSDLYSWSDSRVVAYGGAAGTNGGAAECPYVVYRPDSNNYYLFRTQHYGVDQHTTIYRSRDPENFGIDDDEYLVTTLPVAAPEIIEEGGETYIAALKPTMDGIHIAHLRWVAKH